MGRNRLEIFSMFSGIGGFELGIKKAKCVGYSETDKYADSIYQYQFGGKNFGDATRIIPKEIPDFHKN
jgi:DNA (cytosine-5)-methyltransferase 1